MNKRVRRAMLIVAATSFAVFAPLVVLYAVGYRFVPSAEQTRSVGVLLVETLPRGAVTSVDSTITGTTPEAISGLPEGKVHVELEKEGYSSWTKDVHITPTRATEFRAIKLFAESAPAEIIAEQVKTYSLSPNRLRVALVDTSNSVHVLTDQGQQLQDAVSFPSPVASTLWSPDSTALVVKSGNNYDILSIDNQRTSELHRISVAGIKSLEWDPRLPGRILILRQSGELISYSISTETVKSLAADVKDFSTTSRSLIVSESSGSLAWYTLQGDFQRRVTLPGESIVTAMRATPSGNLAVEQSDGNITVIDREGNNLEVGSGNIVGWAPSGNMLLLQTGASELAVYNVDDERVPYAPLQQLQSIIRLSRPIHHAQWFAGGTHVMFQVDDEIVISEVDTRDHPIQFTVDSTNTGNAEAMVGEDGYSLFYLKVANENAFLANKALVLPEDR